GGLLDGAQRLAGRARVTGRLGGLRHSDISCRSLHATKHAWHGVASLAFRYTSAHADRAKRPLTAPRGAAAGMLICKRFPARLSAISESKKRPTSAIVAAPLPLRPGRTPSRAVAAPPRSAGRRPCGVAVARRGAGFQPELSHLSKPADPHD